MLIIMCKYEPFPVTVTVHQQVKFVHTIAMVGQGESHLEIVHINMPVEFYFIFHKNNITLDKSISNDV